MIQSFTETPFSIEERIFYSVTIKSNPKSLMAAGPILRAPNNFVSAYYFIALSMIFLESLLFKISLTATP